MLSTHVVFAGRTNPPLGLHKTPSSPRSPGTPQSPASTLNSPRSLQDACQHHDYKTFYELLRKKSTDVNETDEQGFTPLMRAVEKGECAMVQRLLKEGASLQSRFPQTQDTLLHRALNNQDIATAGLLAQKGSPMNAHDAAGNTPLMLAAGKRLKPLATKFIDLTTDLNHRNQQGMDILSLCVQNGWTEAVKKLLNKGVSTQNPQLPSLMAQQAAQENIPLVKLLLKAGIPTERAKTELSHLLANAETLKDPELLPLLLKAHLNVNQMNEDGKTPLYLALERYHKICAQPGKQKQLETQHCLRVITQLLAQNADPNRANWDGKTPLKLALDSKFFEATYKLLKSGAETEGFQEPLGQMLLQRIKKNRIKDALKLLDAGADPRKFSRNYSRVAFSKLLLSPKSLSNMETLQLILDLGANPNYRHKKTGNTPLLKAVRESNASAALMLLNRGADPNASNQKGETPFTQAFQKNNFAIYYPLLKAGADPCPQVDNQAFFKQLFAAKSPSSEGQAETETAQGTPTLDHKGSSQRFDLKALWPLKLHWSEDTRDFLKALSQPVRTTNSAAEQS